MIDPVIHWVLVLCLAALWGSAALGKLRHRDDFHRVLQAYQLLPDAAVPVLSLALPLLELAIFVGLLIPGGRFCGALLSTGLLATYALAMTANLYRGRRDIDCGCRPGSKQTLNWSLVVRNTVLAVFSLSLLLPLTQRPMLLADGLVTILIAGFAGMMWLLVPMLRSNSVYFSKGVKQ